MILWSHNVLLTTNGLETFLAQTKVAVSDNDDDDGARIIAIVVRFERF